MRDLSRLSSERSSILMGRVVDSYTNILTVKLFSRAADEDAYVREAVDDHTGAIAAHMRLITKFTTMLAVLNALLLASTSAIGLVLWSEGVLEAGIVAMAVPLAWTIANTAGWVSWEMNRAFREHRSGSGGHANHRCLGYAYRHAGRARPGRRRGPRRAPL